ncbi:CHAT domain-containing protein [Chitinophaga sp. Mgbs1]|uniref:CHAT domain-containing protein n=1 Tax=Chitinophaga solisilvae TaxID=1233460 RepID=A0A3S1BIQ3_9BACT|nr:CHAT domain-containing protein [Chitinophaga solisilvae]
MSDSDFKSLLSRDFRLIDGNASAANIKTRITAAPAAYSIVEDKRRKNYYVYETAELITRLNLTNGRTKLINVVQRDNRKPVAVIGLNDRLKPAADKYIVRNSDKKVVGVVRTEKIIPQQRTRLSEMLSEKLIQQLENKRLVVKGGKPLIDLRKAAGLKAYYQKKTDWGEVFGDKNLVLPDTGSTETPAGGKQEVPGPPGKGTPVGPAEGKTPPEQAGISWFLNADYEHAAVVEEPFPLHLSIDAVTKGKKNKTLNVKEGAEVLIAVSCEKGFRVNGEYTSDTIIVGSKKKITFSLIPLTAGEGQVFVYAYTKGRPLATLELNLPVTAGTKQTSKPLPVSARVIPVIPGHAADLSLLISKTYLPSGEKALGFLVLHAPVLEDNDKKEFVSEPIELNPQEYMQNFFRDIEKLNTDTPKEMKSAVRTLRNKGAELTRRLLPPELADLLWNNRDKIQTISIISQEPWIPWELCCFSPIVEGRVTDGPYFCEQFQVTRWLAGPWSPAEFISFSNAGFIIPQHDNLKHTELERDEIRAMLKEKNYLVEDIPANIETLESKFSEGTYSLLHFSGHGVTANNKIAMMLEDNEEFTPEYINGKLSNVGIRQPFVFFNACQIGRPVMGITGIGGWASRFIEVGASVFIGAYWNVLDERAHVFAAALYKELLQGATIGKAVQTARLATNNNGDPAWLAYTVYADPNAVLKAV